MKVSVQVKDGWVHFSIAIDALKELLLHDDGPDFQSFLVGPSNTVASTFSQTVARNPGKTYPSFYIYGLPGTGKSHLIGAISKQIMNRSPDSLIRVIYGDQCMAEEMQSWLLSDVLVVEDVHQLSDRMRSQRELATVVLEYMKQGKQLIFTSRLPARELVGIDPRLRSFLSAALPVEIHYPDNQLRTALVRKFAKELDLELSDEVVCFLAENCRGNAREIKGCLIKLNAVKELLGIEFTLETVKEHLRFS